MPIFIFGCRSSSYVGFELTSIFLGKVIWFKNWAKLKSIHAMEHFHVMMKDPDMEFIKEITKGDKPVSAQFPEGTILE